MQHVPSVASIVQRASDAVDAQCVNVHVIVTVSPTAETVAVDDRSDSANKSPPDNASNMQTFEIVVLWALVE
jgi:hypothetical protein